VARTELGAAVWGPALGVRSMDYVVGGLRRALRETAAAAGVAPPVIETVPPGCYRLAA
jgi:hypothetical protein